MRLLAIMQVTLLAWRYLRGISTKVIITPSERTIYHQPVDIYSRYTSELCVVLTTAEWISFCESREFNRRVSLISFGFALPVISFTMLLFIYTSHRRRHVVNDLLTFNVWSWSAVTFVIVRQHCFGHILSSHWFRPRCSVVKSLQ